MIVKQVKITAGDNIRLTSPKDFQLNTYSATRFIPRRNTTGVFKEKSLSEVLLSDPYILLKNLPSIHPSVGLALWNATRLTCPANDSRIACYTKDSAGLYNVIDEKCLSYIHELISDQPNEFGGIQGLRSTLTSQLMLTGMCCLEVVPGNNGIFRILPVDSLTIAFSRLYREGDCEPFQKQPVFNTFTQPELDLQYDKLESEFGSIDEQGKKTLRSLFMNGYVHLNRNTFLWRAIDADVDDPYGLSPYATAVIEVVRDLMLIQDLSDAVHNAAWPRTLIGINIKELHSTAVEILRIRNSKLASEWVMDRFKEMSKLIQDVPPGANIAFDSAGDIKTLSPGSFQGIEPILAFLRQRIVQSLKSLPSLMGINDGGTFNFTSVEWQIYSAGLETVRRYIRELIQDVFNLHLRLIGIDARVIIEDEAIRATDALVEANTAAVVIQNNNALYNAGIISQEEFAANTVHHLPDSAKPRAPVVPIDPMNAGPGKPEGKTPAEQGQ